MEVIVNRVEGNYLVLELEDGNIVDVPKELIPEAREGDIIRISIDKEETDKKKEEMQELVDSVFE